MNIFNKILVSMAVVILLSGSTFAATTPEIQYYFTRAGQDPESHLVNVINSAKKTLDIAIYSLTDKPIVNAMISAEKRKVTVRIVTDKVEAKSKAEKAELKLLQGAGIPVKINTHSGLMHLKVTVADNQIATTGSYNYTKAASKENDEVFVVINNPSVAKDFEKEFSAIWVDNSNYENY